MNQVEIHQIVHLPPQILTLEKEATGEGFRFLTRLIAEWHSRTNRFDAPGECLMAAYLNRQLIGIGGLSVDPYTQTNTARLRRVYIAASSRGQHVGRTLVKALVAHAALRFQSVRLSTDTIEGDAFYLHCGFMRTEDAHATHTMLLSAPDSG
ncbi:GNAT family N-acetyltransferase [Pseudomonas sp. NPDC098747]|uniref:GNAT family N-acetyltransferase n=1 Tax=Pseudomonas sp. NPDC098747 TaxID=3364487 RepID=UPI00383AB9BF